MKTLLALLLLIPSLSLGNIANSDDLKNNILYCKFVDYEGYEPTTPKNKPFNVNDVLKELKISNHKTEQTEKESEVEEVELIHHQRTLMVVDFKSNYFADISIMYPMSEDILFHEFKMKYRTTLTTIALKMDVTTNEYDNGDFWVARWLSRVFINRQSLNVYYGKERIQEVTGYPESDFNYGECELIDSQAAKSHTNEFKSITKEILDAQEEIAREKYQKLKDEQKL